MACVLSGNTTCCSPEERHHQTDMRYPLKDGHTFALEGRLITGSPVSQ